MEEQIEKYNLEIERQLQNTNFTDEEYAIFKKVQRNNYLNDLDEIVNEMCEDDQITPNQLKLIRYNIDIILDKFDDYHCEMDWRTAMTNAIHWIID